MEELKAMITDLRFLAAKTAAEEWTLEQASQEALHLAGMLQEHLDEEQERTGITECSEQMKTPEKETTRENLTRLATSHLEYINTHPRVSSPWYWREEILHLPGQKDSNLFSLCWKGEIIERFNSLREIERFTRGMLCVLSMEE